MDTLLGNNLTVQFRHLGRSELFDIIVKFKPLNMSYIAVDKMCHEEYLCPVYVLLLRDGGCRGMRCWKTMVVQQDVRRATNVSYCSVRACIQPAPRPVKCRIPSFSIEACSQL